MTQRADKRLLQTNEEATVADLIRFGRTAGARSLVLAAAGSVSVRMGTERLATSAADAHLTGLTPELISFVSLADGRPLAGAKPTYELELHRRAYMVRPFVGAVIHCQSPAATVLGCALEPPASLDFFPEVPRVVRKHAIVPWTDPYGGELAAAVALALQDRSVTVVQMVNHGQLVVGSTWVNAVNRALIFERACWMATQGIPLRPIPEEAAAQIRRRGKDL